MKYEMQLNVNVSLRAYLPQSLSPPYPHTASLSLAHAHTHAQEISIIFSLNIFLEL